MLVLDIRQIIIHEADQNDLISENRRAYFFSQQVMVIHDKILVGLAAVIDQFKFIVPFLQ